MPSCRPPAGFTLGWVRDSRVGLFLSSRSRGFRVTHPFVDRLQGCHVGAHGMTIYDGASPADTRIPRGAFRPRRDRAFSRSWTQEIALPEGHEGGPPHAFLSTGTLTIRVKRLGPRAAKRLRTRLRAVPRS
jgi:hypothetical protein